MDSMNLFSCLNIGHGLQTSHDWVEGEEADGEDEWDFFGWWDRRLLDDAALLDAGCATCGWLLAAVLAAREGKLAAESFWLAEFAVNWERFLSELATE